MYTTINSRLQQFAEEGMKIHISALQKDFYNHWKGYTKAPYPDDFEWEQINAIIDQGMKRSERYIKLKKFGTGIIYANINPYQSMKLRKIIPSLN